jgi:deoxyribodipyrimidine photo-lyase
MPGSKVIFWYRRDLRFNDNHGLYEALKSGYEVIPVFIFDKNILDELPEDDKRVDFIYQQIISLNEQLLKTGRNLHVYYGFPEEIFSGLAEKYNPASVYTNHDYEPYATERDNRISGFLKSKGIEFKTFKDQVLFEKDEILKSDLTPYVVFTPFSRRWHERKQEKGVPYFNSIQLLDNFSQEKAPEIPSLEKLGFKKSGQIFHKPVIDENLIRKYEETRNFPGLDATSRFGHHLRFGTISVREAIKAGEEFSLVWLNELIWREFFMQILWHYPNVVKNSFRPEYDRIQWRNDEAEFENWKNGLTGYPMVDAGMRELEHTGFMHNRVRMITASFLSKHLLIDWRRGEAWFAEKLLDYELSSNNGNWQWAAGTGCDAAPYFRIFNPSEQQKKFDKDLRYIRKWLPEYGTSAYPKPMVEHTFARNRCLATYTAALKP